MSEINKINHELRTIMTSFIPDGILLIADKKDTQKSDIHLVNNEFRRLFNLENLGSDESQAVENLFH